MGVEAERQRVVGDRVRRRIGEHQRGAADGSTTGGGQARHDPVDEVGGSPEHERAVGQPGAVQLEQRRRLDDRLVPESRAAVEVDRPDPAQRVLPGAADCLEAGVAGEAGAGSVVPRRQGEALEHRGVARLQVDIADRVADSAQAGGDQRLVACLKTGLHQRDAEHRLAVAAMPISLARDRVVEATLAVLQRRPWRCVLRGQARELAARQRGCGGGAHSERERGNDRGDAAPETESFSHLMEGGRPVRGQGGRA